MDVQWLFQNVASSCVVKICSLPSSSALVHTCTVTETEAWGPPDSSRQGKALSAASLRAKHRAWHTGAVCPELNGTGLMSPIHDPGSPGRLWKRVTDCLFAQD